METFKIIMTTLAVSSILALVLYLFLKVRSFFEKLKEEKSKNFTPVLSDKTNQTVRVSTGEEVKLPETKTEGQLTADTTHSVTATPAQPVPEENVHVEHDTKDRTGPGPSVPDSALSRLRARSGSGS